MGNRIQKKLNYSLTQRPKPLHPEAPRLYYANAQIWSVVKLDELAERISKQCTAHKADIYAVLMALSSEIPEILAEGQSVQIPYFGTFHLSIRSKGVERKEDFNEKCIKDVSVRFRPGTEFREMLRTLEFSETDPKYIITNKEEGVLE